MKTFKHFSLIAAVLLLAFVAQTAYAGNHSGKKKNDQQNLVTIKGKVVDAESRAPLVFATKERLLMQKAELRWCLQLLPSKNQMWQL